MKTEPLRSPSIIQYADMVRRMIGEGATPETHPFLRGLTKEVQLTSTVETPGQRFKPVTQTVKCLVPDEEAIKRRLFGPPAFDTSSLPVAPVASLDRVDFLELEASLT
jgi:hypothetical protein